MMNTAKLMTTAALALVTSVPAQAQETDTTTPAQAQGAETTAPAEAVDAGTVVATVNGTDITLGELIVARSQLPQQYQGLPDEVLFQSLLDQIINQQLFADQLEQVPPRLAYTIANQERSLRAGEALNQIAQGAATDEAVQEAYAAYEALTADDVPTMEYNASHILVETEEEAQAIIDRIEGGEDFATVAQEESTGPTGPGGGELGWFGPGQMVQLFEEAVMQLEPGEVSQPVQTQFGWHVIRLNETREQETPALEELRPELEAQVQQQAVEARLTELTEAAEITRPEEGAFDPALLSDTTLLEE